jgi:lipopolysaccharide transport system ATP-binding protein
MKAIEFNHVGKQYRLGLVSTGTFSHDLSRWWAMNVLGKEDPYLKIGDTNVRSTKGDSDFVWALKDINFSVEQGDVVGIIGKNGAGKSTLLKLLSRVTAPTVGEINVCGRIASLLEVGTGFHPEMTGRENIYMNGAIMGMTKAEINRKLDEIVDFSGCERYIDTPVKRYSSGMKVRLGFSVAAHLEPDILVVDEVLAVGDAEFQKKAIGKMQDVSKGEGRTVLFVSHNMTSVKKLCKNGIILRDGMIDHHGDIESAIDRYLESEEERCNIDISSITDRKGNGFLQFTGIHFFDNSGHERRTFEIGESVYIEVEFEKKNEMSKIKHSRIDIGINDMMNQRVTWISSQIYFDRIPDDRNSLVFEIPELLLAEGEYNFNLFCTSDLGTVDWVQNVANLKTVFHDYYHTGRAIPSNQGYFVTNFKMK